VTNVPNTFFFPSVLPLTWKFRWSEQNSVSSIYLYHVQCSPWSQKVEHG